MSKWTFLSLCFFLLLLLLWTPSEAECVIEWDVHSLSSLINIIRMQLLWVGATRMNDLLIFFPFILHRGYITKNDCERLRDATDLIEERERNYAMCEDDAIIIILLAERTRELSLISSRLSLDCLWSLDARAHVYNKQDSMYVCGERRNFFLILYIVIECRC